MIKAEHLNSNEKLLSEIVDFLASNLSSDHTVHVGLIAAMWNAGALKVITKRGDRGVLLAAQLWLSMHNPVKGGQNMIRKLAECGDLTGFDEASTIAFSMLEHGYEVLP